MKKFLNSPWTIAIGAVAFSFLLSVGYDLFKGKKFFTTINSIFAWIGAKASFLLNFEIKIWWILVVIVALLILLLVLAGRSDASLKNNPDVPEFSKTAWSPLHLSEIDFSDELNSYKWPKAGLAWGDTFIGSAVSPTPAEPIPSSLLDIVERERVGDRYYLTSNAAEGILRRVDNQGRKLFPLSGVQTVRMPEGLSLTGCLNCS